ncbi:7-methylguanosine phosphate-specific 5'-nucleotidase-like [Pseudopipra pipra]|uniref:7-methylguanosine phosphate-specific 5'-nucleotidase-like n=1 Tax=Pseudopipra pipra TaxID=415032 RepID=UPI003139A300
MFVPAVSVWSELKDLLHYYYPIGIDPNRTLEEKCPLMVEWDGFKEFFDQLHKNSVPLFIFSAGVGDVLEEIIRQASVFYSNVNVVSNYMDFDDDGVLTHFKAPLIHTYHKNNTVLQAQITSSS